MKPAMGSKSNTSNQSKNPLETLKNAGGDFSRETAASLPDSGTGIFDQLMGMDNRSGAETIKNKYESRPRKSGNREIKTIFSFQQEQETRTIRSLVEQLKQEVKLLKQADSSFIQEVKDIEKLTIDSLPEKPGIYHVRFLELLISIIRTLRAKISESRTWLMAFQSKKKKRGSAFAVMSKKKGTQFSLSQELSNARSVQ